MRLRNLILPMCIILAATLAVSLGARAAGEAAQAGAIALSVAPHLGAEAIDVSGTGPPGRPLTITLLSTFSRDLPDVVLSRTSVVPNASGAFSATISIAPGFTRGSLITISASSFAGGPSARAQYRPDWPNHVVPLDEYPPSIR